MSTPTPTSTPSVSAWTPLRHRVFGVLWVATLVSNVGTWMHDVGAGWLMTSLAPSPTMVSLVQAATTLPVFLFSLPAGALADRFDRRRLLLALQLFMMLLALSMCLLVWLEHVTPWLLLCVTFAMGMGNAAASPTWQSIVPRLVPKEDFPAAVALNAVAINLSRTIGPAVGGAIIVALGLAWPFLVNAISFLAVIAALLWWRPAQEPPRAAQGGFIAAMRVGVTHVFRTPALRAVMLRCLAFFVFASVYWALLPLIARNQLNGGAQLYGAMVGCIGAGAVAGAQFLPRLRQRFGPDHVLRGATFGTIAALGALATVRMPSLAGIACAVAGACWIAAISTLTVATQLLLPDELRARGLAVYNTLFYGALTLGSVCWGQIAERAGIAGALLIASAGALLAMTATWRMQLAR